MASSVPRPAVSGRQVKACKACRITKIKCIMPSGQPPCERCTARELACEKEVPAQGPAAGSETHLRPRPHIPPETSVGDMYQLQTAVSVLLRTCGLPHLSSYSTSRPSTVEETAERRANESSDCDGGDEAVPTVPIRTPLTAEDNNPYALPVNSLYEVTKLPSLRNPSQQPSLEGSQMPTDFISRGVISLQNAEELFRQYKQRLDFFCYGITCPHDTLDGLRASSRLLTAAVCTVAALHRPQGSPIFKACHAEFLRLVSSAMFSISYSIDDIRALVIGCWWLGNVSYTLLGHAIRVATRLDYHLAYFSVIDHTAQDNDLLKARLWYILYVMDQHSAVLYGRPSLLSPMEEQHSQFETFIRENGECEVDLRISSQVALYHVLARANTIFGTHSVKALPEHCFSQLQSTFSEVDRWYMVWGNRMPRNSHVGWFPRDGAILNYHFARLHLCSYVFRGASPDSITITSPKARECVSIAVTSAAAVLQLVQERDDLRAGLTGMPIYFHGMTNFAAVFLIKAIRNSFWGLMFADVSPYLTLVQNYVNELKAQDVARQHLVYHLSSGLEGMMQALMNAPNTDNAPMSQDLDISVTHMQSAPQEAASMFSIDTFNMLQGPLDDPDMGLSFGIDLQ